MIVLIYGLLSFIAAFLIHLIVWKISVLKKNQTVVLLEIFFAVSVLSVTAISAFGNLCEYFAYLFLYYSLALCYIVSYSAIEVDSPSLAMVLEIAKEGALGLDKERFYSRMSDDLLVIPRIEDLANDGMISKEGDKYKLTAKGAFLADLFILWRALLNAGKGG